jgi:hypothetical protein
MQATGNPFGIFEHKAAPGGAMSKTRRGQRRSDGGWVYTQQKPAVQNENSD